MRLPTTPRNAHPTDDRGAVAVIVALFMSIFLLLLAFTVDFGRAYATKAQLQSAADSAALAAARDLPLASGSCATNPSATACQVALDYALANGAPAGEVDVESPYGGNGRSIAVEVTQTVPYFLGPLFGLPEQTITARAAAVKASTALGSFAFFTESTLDSAGNPTVGGDVYAGTSFAITGNTTVNGSVWAGGLASPASAGTLRVTGGSARVNGNATATGAITVHGANSDLGVESPNSVVQPITAVEYADSIDLDVRIADDLADPDRTDDTSGGCNLSSAGATTTVLVCTGTFSIASNNNWTTAKPNLRTVIADSFSWSGNQTMGTWPSNPFLLYATGTGGFSGTGSTTLNGYLYAPNGPLALAGNKQGDFRAITQGNITARGNMSTTQVFAYEDSILGGVRLTE